MTPFRLLFPVRLFALVLALATAVTSLRAHAHIDVGPDAADAARLGFVGPSAQIALYVPPGEPFSNYAPYFPGGYYANELAFSSEDAAGSRPRVELLSVQGPPGGAVAFWEAGASAPSWSRAAGWTATSEDRPSLITYEDQTGYGHIHGRIFTVTHPGSYTLVFRAVDDAGLRAPSTPRSLALDALAPPALALRVEASTALLSFVCRANLTYDLQVSTDLVTWSGVEPHLAIFGTGGQLELSDPLAGRPRVFYRLVEYY